MISWIFTILLDFTLQGISIQIHPNNTGGVVQTELNKTVSLICELDSEAEDDNTLVWLRNGAKINLKEENTKGLSNVCISPVVYEDNGATFSCYLHSNASVKASVTLNVTCESLLVVSNYIITS